MRRIAIIDGHPDRERHFCHALADSYEAGAAEGGHEVRRIALGETDVPFLRSRKDWEGPAAPQIVAAQEVIGWADHIVLIYPLWLGAMPALVKAFLEQVFRPGFMIPAVISKTSPFTPKSGKSARIIVTMGMPAFVYRWYFGAHSLRSLERNILAFVGIKPQRHTLIGLIEGMSEEKRAAWLEKVAALGRKAA